MPEDEKKRPVGRPKGPKPKVPPKAPAKPEAPTVLPAEEIDRLELEILPPETPPGPAPEATEDIDLDASVSEAPPAAPPKTQEPEVMGAWRPKRMIPIIRDYGKGLMHVIRNRKLQSQDEIDAYALGLDRMLDASLEGVNLLLEKYLVKVQYAEEIFVGASLLSSWIAARRLDARLKAAGGPGAARPG